MVVTALAIFLWFAGLSWCSTAGISVIVLLSGHRIREDSPIQTIRSSVLLLISWHFALVATPDFVQRLLGLLQQRVRTGDFGKRLVGVGLLSVELRGFAATAFEFVGLALVLVVAFAVVDVALGGFRGTALAAFQLAVGVALQTLVLDWILAYLSGERVERYSHFRSSLVQSISAGLPWGSSAPRMGLDLD